MPSRLQWSVRPPQWINMTSTCFYFLTTKIFRSEKSLHTTSEHGKSGNLDILSTRMSVSVKAPIESCTNDANWVTLCASSSSVLLWWTSEISGIKLVSAWACSIANLTPSFHVPWYKTEAKVQTARASWGWFTNARWNAKSPTLSHAHKKFSHKLLKQEKFWERKSVQVPKTWQLTKQKKDTKAMN